MTHAEKKSVVYMAHAYPVEFFRMYFIAQYVEGRIKLQVQIVRAENEKYFLIHHPLTHLLGLLGNTLTETN